MIGHLFLSLSLLFVLSVHVCCHAQDNSSKQDRSVKSTEVPAIGETVSELDKAIFVVYQAKNNDYWFGSDGQGVYRYDGTTATHFTTNDGLSNNRIREIQEDKFGNIYFSTQEGGVSKFDGQKFSTLRVNRVSLTNVWKLEPDDLWFKGESGKNGPYRYDGKTLYHLEFPKHHLADKHYADNPNASYSPYDVYKIYKDHRGHLWFGTSNLGICRFDGKSLDWMYEQHLTEIAGGGWFGIRSILEDKRGDFWFCNTKYRYGVHVSDAPTTNERDKNTGTIDYQRKEGIANLRSLDGKDLLYFMSILEDSHGDLWMATYNEGVWRYDGTNVTRYPVKEGDKEITLFAIHTDNQGELWLGTHEHGAYKFNGKIFEKFQPKK